MSTWHKLNKKIKRVTVNSVIFCFDSYRAVESKRKQHHKEEQCPEGGAGHGCYGFRINNKHESWTFCGHVCHVLAWGMCHIAEYWEDNESCHETRAAIDHTRHQRVSIQMKINNNIVLIILFNKLTDFVKKETIIS